MRIIVPLLALVAACTGSSTTAPPPQELPVDHPDVVIITLDTTRADRLGFYGDPLARTPHLDALAEQSVVFREATTPVPLTLPAHTSLFSGWYPARHGLRDNGGFSVDAKVPLLAERLKAEGYETGAFVAAYVLDSAWGLDRGFDRYFDDFHPEDVRRASRFGAVERPAREVVREALAWWEDPARGEAPRLMWVHLFDAHTPYEPPADWKGDPYRGEIFEMDRALRPLLQSLPEDALVVIAGDHGENLWDGGELEHGIVLTRSTTRVPLLIRPPGGVEGKDAPTPRTLPERPGDWTPVDGLSVEGLDLAVVPDAPVAARVVQTPVSLVDVVPTVLDLLDLTSDTTFDGRSLAPVLAGEELADKPVYSETVAPWTHYGWSPQHVARDGSRLALRDAGDAVYDPIADPWWQTPLDEPVPDPLAAMLKAESVGWEHPGGSIDPATAKALDVLGYATAKVEAPTEDRPSARTRIDRMNRLLLAQGRMASDPEGALAEFEALTKSDPDLVDAWFSLGTMRWGKGDGEGAVAALKQVVERAPDHPLAWNNLIVVFRETGRADEALQTARDLAASHPKDTRWHRHIVDLLGRREAPLEVIAASEAGIEQVGEDPFLLYMLGLARLQTGDPPGAIEALERSKAAGTEAPDVSLWIGQAHSKLGHIDEAVAAWKAQSNRTPNDPRALVAAALLLVEHERCPEALPLLMTATQRGVRDQRIKAAFEACGG